MSSDGKGFLGTSHEFLVCKALASYKARYVDEISFTKGDLVDILLEKDPEADAVEGNGVNAPQLSQGDGMEPSGDQVADSSGNLLVDDLTAHDIAHVIKLAADARVHRSGAATKIIKSFSNKHNQKQDGGASRPFEETWSIEPYSSSAVVDHTVARSPAQQGAGEWVEAAANSMMLDKVFAHVSKSPRPLHVEVQHCYLLGKSMEDLWHPREEVVRRPFPVAGMRFDASRCQNHLEKQPETSLPKAPDQAEILRYYQLGKSVQEIWTRVGQVDAYGRDLQYVGPPPRGLDNDQSAWDVRDDHPLTHAWPNAMPSGLSASGNGPAAGISVLPTGYADQRTGQNPRANGQKALFLGAHSIGARATGMSRVPQSPAARRGHLMSHHIDMRPDLLPEETLSRSVLAQSAASRPLSPQPRISDVSDHIRNQGSRSYGASAPTRTRDPTDTAYVPSGSISARTRAVSKPTDVATAPQNQSRVFY